MFGIGYAVRKKGCGMRRQRQGEFGILVDNQTAWENVCRTAEGRSWVVKENCEIDDYFKIIVASDA